MIKKISRVFLVVFILLSLVGYWAFQRSAQPDYDYTQQSYFKETVAELQTLPALDTAKSVVYCGWSKENIIPKIGSQRIIGFGFKKHFEGYWDSLFVRAVTFSQTNKRFVMLNFDLLMVHPQLKAAIEKGISEQQLPVDGVFYSATHTHNGFGGFANGPVSYFILGGYDQEVVDFLVDKAVTSIRTAIDNEKKSSIGNAEKNMGAYVKNRVIKDGPIDPMLRLIKVVQEDGETAVLWSFSAHATCLYQEEKPFLSSEYPGEVNQMLTDTPQVDFALFLAGGVGSHNPVLKAYFLKDKHEYALALSDSILRVLPDIKVDSISTINFRELSLHMPKASVRISDGIALSNNLFRFAFGKSSPYLSELTINKNYFIGTPCDFNGELGLPIMNKAKERDLNVLITSFNGEYIGYITPDYYYFTQSHRELWSLNWFGYGNGGYFSEIIQGLIDKE